LDCAAIYVQSIVLPVGGGSAASCISARPSSRVSIQLAHLQGSSLVRARPSSRGRFFSAQCGIPTFLASSRMPDRVFASRWLR
jgi:hypothetical protein